MNLVHTILVDLHSINRWIIVLLGLYVLFLSARGWFGRRAWGQAAEKGSRYFLIALDVQLLLGVVLYFVFLSRQGGFAHVFGNPASRFFLMEHSVMMLLAIILAHVGGYFVKKAQPESKFKRMFIFYGVAFLLILVSIPWPFMPGYGRPWLL
ncbi:MAG TPA: cytochrome B [Anaerolineae bacterium]|nr:cytochrome B [Anaerolineae bacterium]